MLIFKKEKQVRKLVLEHIATVHDCISEARAVFEEYVAGDMSTACARALVVNQYESRADELEQEIREILNQGAFLPQIRADVYTLVEQVDGVAGKAENTSNFVINQMPDIPEEFEADLIEIFGLCVTSFHELRKALKDFFKPKGQFDTLHEHVSRVSDIESEVDKKEAALTRRIFTSSIDLSAKIHLRLFLTEITKIADSAEDVSDELVSAAMRTIL